MAHAAPASGTRTPSARSRTPDVFSERAHRAAEWTTPVALGLVYGYWVAANNRSGGPITGWNLLLGFVSAIVFAALWTGIHALAPHMRRELHALLWTAFAGCAFGFLYSQTGATVLRSVGMSLAISAGVFLTLFYRFYTQEDAAGKRIR
ncbi:hypothetical protein OHU34_20840 [Streptomyces sp. NBC_00080]|uniref:hypothetical protein n=1 Tax=Streptomyces TaxID=1883 RepID=UPI0006CE0864|nr:MULTISPECIES: hypothetical protein [Streptomyces]KPI26827.1 hypothetical protein OV320_6496 [Actinobacteria bacterium OV320]TQJ54383.1 hypothetical protein FBY34_2156 [Streptomyces sp. SLBN-115]